MAEELRIVVVDEGGGAPAVAPRAPRSSEAPVSPRATAPASRSDEMSADEFAALRARVGRRAKDVDAKVAAGRAAAGSAPRSRRRRAGAKAASGAASGAAASSVKAAAFAASVAAVVAGFTSAALAVKAFSDTVESETQRLSAFSGEVALARAQTDVARQLAQIRRAREIGPELSAAERVRSKFEIAATDLGTEILEAVLNLAANFEPVIEVVIQGMKLLTKFLDKYGDEVGLGAGALLKNAFPTVSLLSDILKWIRQFLPEDDNQDAVDMFTREFMDLLPVDEEGKPLFFSGGL